MINVKNKENVYKKLVLAALLMALTVCAFFAVNGTNTESAKADGSGYVKTYTSYYDSQVSNRGCTLKIWSASFCDTDFSGLVLGTNVFSGLSSSVCSEYRYATIQIRFFTETEIYSSDKLRVSVAPTGSSVYSFQLKSLYRTSYLQFKFRPTHFCFEITFIKSDGSSPVGYSFIQSEVYSFDDYKYKLFSNVILSNGDVHFADCTNYAKYGVGHFCTYVPYGEEIPYPNGNRRGTSLLKYYRKNGSTEPYDWNTTHTGGLIELYPLSCARSEVAYVKTNGGNQVGSVIQNDDGTFPRPETPVKARYKFENWYSDEALTTVYDFSQPYEGDGLTLYADWADLRKTVTFETNGGNAIDPVNVYEGEKILPPTAPVKEDKVFEGWYSDTALTQKFNFNSAVTQDITLYAKWLDVCTVMFNTNGGSTIDPVKVTQGKIPSVPNTPTLAGKGFGGWYTDSALTKKYLFDTPVENSFTLYAKWTTDYVIVRLVIIPAKQERDVLIERNSKLYKPITPTLYGFKFGGWFTDGGTFENEYDFNKPVETDLKLYIRWDIDYIPVTVNKCDDSKVRTIDVQRGKTLELENPTRVGYTFQGWFTDEELTAPFDPETVVEEPFNVYAKWLKDTEKPSEFEQIKDEIKDITDKAKVHANKVGDFFKKNWFWFVIGLSGGVLIWLVIAIIIEVKRK